MFASATDPSRRRLHPIPLTLLFTGFIAANYGFGVYLFSAIMPDMIAALSLTYSDAGTVMSASQAGFLLSALASGFLTDRIGAVNLILLSVLCSAVSLFLMPFASDTTTLGLLLFMTGAASASVWVPMVVVAKAMIPEQHQGKALGLMSSGTAYGVFVNGLAIPRLLPAHGWESVWIFVGTLTALLLVVGIVFLRGQRVESAPSTSRERDVGLGTLLRPGYLLVPLMMFLSGIACMPTQNYLVALVRDELDYGVAAAANIWKTIGFIGMFGGFLMGVVADRITVRWALVMSYGLLSLSLLCFLHHPGLTVIYAGAAIFGLAFNAIFGLLPAYVSLVFPRHLTAAIFGLGNVMLGLGAMAGNFLGGFIKDGTGSFHLVYLGALVATAFLFGLAFMLRKPVIVDAQHAATKLR